MHADSAILVFSHLRWGFVFQRPQHLLSRLARLRPVYFVEEPIHTPDRPAHWEISQPHSGVTVCRPHTPCASGGFHDDQLPVLEELVSDLCREQSIHRPVVWMYTPMALPLVDGVDPRAIVFDCMDELSAFLNAPRQLLDREAQLLERADVVFTGGPSLYKAKKDRHANVHCFTSSVDAAHFAKAMSTVEAPADQAAIPGPRLGFFGVIDERIDLELLDTLAQRRPDWQIVMVGPVVKISESALPRRPNLHYLGQRQYAELPAYLAGWDVCLLPFARNEATRFISPTKTLEYMAAEKPIVSTPIVDVAEPYGDIVYLGDTPDEFLAACEAALTSDQEERRQRVEKMRRVLAKTSWDEVAERMNELIGEAVARRERSAGAEGISKRAKPVAGLPADDLRNLQNSPEVIVIGAGPTGLSAAYHLGEDALLLEKNDCVGGWCRSIEEDGFTFDFAGHIMFSNDPYVHELYRMLLGENVHWQDREAWIYSHDVYTRYPFQGALYGLPPEVIKECIVGAIEARFGSTGSDKSKAAPSAKVAPAQSNGNGASTKGNGNGKLTPTASAANGQVKSNGAAPGCDSNKVVDCCADGVLESTARLAATNGNGNGRASPEPANFEEFIYKVWGKGIARHFAIPYNRKLWAVPLAEMETSWLGGRVPMPDLEEMIEGALQPVPKPMGPNARFGYPLRGGFQSLMNGFLPYLEECLRLGVRVVAISPERRTIELSDGSVLSYEQLVSTMPLPMLIKCMGNEAPGDIQEAARGLRHVSVRCVHLGVGRENLTEKHWIYYPEDTVFHRIFVQGNASPYCNAPGGFGLTCEITYSPHKPLPCDGDALIEQCIRDCHRVGIFSPDDPIWVATQVDMPYAYVVYDHHRARHVARIRQWLLERGIVLAGRYSEWEYYNSDHAFVAGKKAADAVRQLRAAPAGPRLSSVASRASVSPLRPQAKV